MSILAHGLRAAAGNAGDEGNGVSYNSFYTIADNTSATKTFASVDIGTPNADRYVIVTLQWVNGGGVTTLNSATINGVSASVIQSSASTFTSAHGAFFAKVPTGTSVTIQANLSGTTFSGYSENIAVYTFNTPSVSFELTKSNRAFNVNSVDLTGYDTENPTVQTPIINVATNEFLVSNVTINGVREDISVDELTEDTYQTNANGTNFYASYTNNTASSQLIAPTFSWGGGALNALASAYKFSY